MADWNERYANGEYSTAEPNKLLVEWARKLKAGYALDIACGAGRHAILLAHLGWKVMAVDSSEVGIEITKARAAEDNLVIKTVIADLEKGEFAIAANYYDLICDFYYLQRDLFPKIKEGIRAGGAFISAIHIVGAKDDEQHMNPAFLMQEGELLEIFKDWNIKHYYETTLADDDKGKHHHRTAEIVAIKPYG